MCDTRIDQTDRTGALTPWIQKMPRLGTGAQHHALGQWASARGVVVDLGDVDLDRDVLGPVLGAQALAMDHQPAAVAL